MKLIDLSFDVESNMPTCGTSWHQTVSIEPMGTIETVGRNTHRILLGSHSGTHMDAPFHFIPGGNTIEQLDISRMCGSVTVVDLRRYAAGSVVPLEAIEKVTVTERMLFVFGWYKNWKTDRYYRDFPYFSREAILYMLDKGMKFMAMDTPSPDTGSAIGETGDDSPNHKLLLENGVVIVEYLNNTDELSADLKYEIMALPLRVKGSDGSPCRVIVKEV